MARHTGQHSRRLAQGKIGPMDQLMGVKINDWNNNEDQTLGACSASVASKEEEGLADLRDDEHRGGAPCVTGEEQGRWFEVQNTYSGSYVSETNGTTSNYSDGGSGNGNGNGRDVNSVQVARSSILHNDGQQRMRPRTLIETSSCPVHLRRESSWCVDNCDSLILLCFYLYERRGES